MSILVARVVVSQTDHWRNTAEGGEAVLVALVLTVYVWKVTAARLVVVAMVCIST